MNYKKKIINVLVELTNRGNDDIKISAISALGDYQATIEHEDAINRLLDLCQNSNKEIAITSINSLSKLSKYF